MTEMPTRGWRQEAGVVCWKSLQGWSLVGCWLLAHVVQGRNALPGTRRKWQVAELLAAWVSEGWNDFSLLLALSFPGEHLEKIIPLIVQYCNVEDDELREYCFQAFESFVRRCVPLRNNSAPSCASASSWCKYLYVWHQGLSTFLHAFLLGRMVHKWNLFFTCRVGLELWAILPQHVRVCFCIGFAGVGVFLVLGGFLSKRELPRSGCVEGVGGRKGAQAEELLSCSSPVV